LPFPNEQQSLSETYETAQLCAVRFSMAQRD